MTQLQIHATLFVQMMRAGAKHLSRHVETVNALNVFPVPDGDTGTNMNLTFLSGVKEMETWKHVGTVGKLAEALSKGLLMGARGNSGVILSQLFRGFTKAVSDQETINASQLADAFQRGVETAYQAVIKPVEGTILTVSREAAKAGVKYSQKTSNPVIVMEAVLNEARQALARTPELLPVLKQTGVVDAGGQGLVLIYEGILSALKGEEEEEGSETLLPSLDSIAAMAHQQNAQSMLDPSEIEHGYCTEFMILPKQDRGSTEVWDEGKFRQELEQFGDSLLVVSDEELIKVHIHAERPGDVLNFAMQVGDLTRIKIDNMREQHEQVTKGTIHKEKKRYGIVAVAVGTGIVQLFQSLGVDVVIEGGQTMNPSTQEIIQAIGEMEAEQVIILPNNKNVILTAEQASELVDVPVTVLPTKTIPQGLAALIAFSPDTTAVENKKKMMTAFAHIRSGEVTYAVRDTHIDDLTIKEGDYLGIDDGKIKRVGNDLSQIAQKLLDDMVDKDTEIVTVIYGKDVNQQQVEELKGYLEEKYPDVEVEVHDGGQPLYYYLFSVE